MPKNIQIFSSNQKPLPIKPELSPRQRASYQFQIESYIKQQQIMMQCATITTQHYLENPSSDSPINPWQSLIETQRRYTRTTFPQQEYTPMPAPTYKTMTPGEETEFLESITNLKWSNSFPKNR